MPGPDIEPVDGDRTAPASADVVVVGGGIVGCCTALELAERGASVVLCEKGIVGGEQSGRNWGWVRLSGRDPREIDLMAASIRLWEGMAERTGTDVGYRQSGLLAPFADPAARRRAETWLTHIEGTQHRIGLVDEGAVRDHGYALPHEGGLLAHADGRAEPQRAAPAVARAARARGATVLTGCAVRGLEVDGGRVSGVVTERGRIACDRVVVAGGAWSRLLLRGAGVTLPQLKVIGSVLRTGSVADGPRTAVRGPGFAVRPREDGGYTVATFGANIHELTPDSLRFLPLFWPMLRAESGAWRPRLSRRFLTEWRAERRRGANEASAFEATRVLDPAPHRPTVDGALARLAKAYPAFKDATVEQRWAGAIDVTPDAVPVISTVHGRPGLVVATGFSGHGFGMGPGAGRLAADLALGAPPVVEPAAFRLSRFSDGTPLQRFPGL
ncbi:NAD(P)/FAD-dependent oxidoreductase [Acuticoccus sp.]|uniref:NAD(P)/FAD-dependent oxidoreductase n=1 Tax=Acuticoccus sp. TaxID=1904378 RepID=UPI003B52D6BD